MNKNAFHLVLLLAGVALAAGCTSDENLATSEDVTEVELALSTVPTGVQCVRVTVMTGTATVTPPLITVAAGASSANLGVGALAAGPATFSGAAFNTACTSVTGSTTATWIAPAVTTTLNVGVANKVTLNFLPNSATTVNGNFVSPPVELALGYDSTRVRLADNTVREWGRMPNGNVVTQPTAVSGLTDAVQVASGFDAACARRATGGVSCWGNTSNWGGSGNVVSTPVAVTFPSGNVTHITLGQGWGCGQRGMAVDCFGYNYGGQFGNGTYGNIVGPTNTGLLTTKVFAGGLHSCKFGQYYGSVDCAGYNWDGQLGDPSAPFQSEWPRAAQFIVSAVDIALGGSHSCIVRGDGAVFCWGSNFYGELGDGTIFNTHRDPIQVVGMNDAVRVVAGLNHTCVLRKTGTVSCWGLGAAIGDGVGEPRVTPVEVPGLSNVIALDAHLGRHTCAILADRTLKCWGDNSSGQIDGTMMFAATPVTVNLQ